MCGTWDRARLARSLLATYRRFVSDETSAIPGSTGGFTACSVRPSNALRFFRDTYNLSTMQLTNRIALVTGAAGGIGSAVCRELAAQGASVCLADLNSTASLAAELRTAGHMVMEVAADVTSRTSIANTVSAVCERWGRLDVLVNVAGTVSLGTAADITEIEWDRVLSVNLKGTFLACQAVMAVMRAQRYGRIINIGSVLGKNGGNPRPWIDATEQKNAANAAYGASKAGVHSLTFYLAKELAADGITVNAVAPGPVASAMTTNFPEMLRRLIPAGRMGANTDVAAAVAFLASERSAFITGEILDVNGGMWCD
jgi:3-oxoacyl-[acyl-carrier protein] reductase